MAAANADLSLVKKPQSAYFLWLNATRAELVKEFGTTNPTVLSGKAGGKWKSLSAAVKKPYEDDYTEKKAAYDKYIATDEGKKALEEKKAAASDVKAGKTAKADAKADKIAKKDERKNAIACKAAVKAVEKDDALKKPVSAYWMWLADNRERIVKIVGSGACPVVAKKAGEMWKTLSEADRQPYEKKAKDMKEAHDKFIATPEGQAAMKAFKDKVASAKDGFKPKENDSAAPPPVSPAGKKRKGTAADEAPAADSGTAPKKEILEHCRDTSKLVNLLASGLLRLEAAAKKKAEDDKAWQEEQEQALVRVVTQITQNMQQFQLLVQVVADQAQRQVGGRPVARPLSGRRRQLPQ